MLRRRAGRDRADDLFQETFLRALRAYGRLEHGEHLRAWVLTIATNAVVDGGAAGATDGRAVGRAGRRGRAARPFEELAPLTDDLPPKERAAVVLRYGYDLDYDDDRRRARLERAGGATGGLRRRAAAAEGEGAAMTAVPTVLDERFRAAAAASGELDVAYDVLDDTPVGTAARRRLGPRPLPRQLRPGAGRRARAARPAVRPARPALAEGARPRAPRARRVLRRPPARLRPGARPPRRRRSSTGACSRS